MANRLQLRAAAALELRRRNGANYSKWDLQCWDAVIQIHFEGVKCPLYSPGITTVFGKYGGRHKWFDKKLGLILSALCERWKSEGIAPNKLKGAHYFAEAVKEVNHCLTGYDWAEWEAEWAREAKAYEDKIYRRIPKE